MDDPCDLVSLFISSLNYGCERCFKMEDPCDILSFFRPLSTPSSPSSRLSPVLFPTTRCASSSFVCWYCSDSSAFAAEDGGDEDDGTRFNNSLAARVNTAGTTAPQLSSLHLPEQDDPSDDCKLLLRTAASSTAKAKTINSGCGIEFKYLINEEGEPPCRVTRKRGYGVLVRDGGDNSEPPKSKWDLLGSSPESSILWFGPGGLLTSSRVRWILVLQCLIAVRMRGGGHATNSTVGVYHLFSEASSVDQFSVVSLNNMIKGWMGGRKLRKCLAACVPFTSSNVLFLVKTSTDQLTPRACDSGGLWTLNSAIIRTAVLW